MIKLPPTPMTTYAEQLSIEGAQMMQFNAASFHHDALQPLLER